MGLFGDIFMDLLNEMFFKLPDWLWINGCWEAVKIWVKDSVK